MKQLGTTKTINSDLLGFDTTVGAQGNSVLANTRYSLYALTTLPVATDLTALRFSS